jgi:hypothetical protein
MPITDDPLTQIQREALWKWRWLGWRNSTPAFKVSIAVLALVAIAMSILAVQ